MSVAGCYTDFHIDFGGTSVWYHILHGEKVRKDNYFHIVLLKILDSVSYGSSYGSISQCGFLDLLIHIQLYILFQTVPCQTGNLSSFISSKKIVISFSHVLILNALFRINT